VHFLDFNNQDRPHKRGYIKTAIQRGYVSMHLLIFFVVLKEQALTHTCFDSFAGMIWVNDKEIERNLLSCRWKKWWMHARQKAPLALSLRAESSRGCLMGFHSLRLDLGTV